MLIYLLPALFMFLQLSAFVLGPIVPSTAGANSRAIAYGQNLFDNERAAVEYAITTGAIGNLTAQMPAHLPLGTIAQLPWTTVATSDGYVAVWWDPSQGPPLPRGITALSIVTAANRLAGGDPTIGIITGGSIRSVQNAFYVDATGYGAPPAGQYVSTTAVALPASISIGDGAVVFMTKIR